MSIIRAKGEGIETLIRAAPSVTEAQPAARFLIVGDGPMANIWKRRVQQCAMEDRFIFTGHVPYTDVPYYIGAMDICVAPITADSNQASPVKLFDYMASERPIVASDVPAVREIVGNCGCAELLPAGRAEELARALIELLADHPRQRAMAAAGRKRVVEKFNRAAIADALISIGGSIGGTGSRRT